MPLKIKLKGKATRTDDDSRTKFSISHLTLSDLLAGESRPTSKTLAKVQAFLEAEAKRNAESEKVLSEPISEATAHCV
jgi:hypothetical protein